MSDEYEYDHEHLFDDDENGDPDEDSPNGVFITATHKKTGKQVGHLHIHQDDIGRSHYDIGDIHVNPEHRRSKIAKNIEPPSEGMIRHANEVLDAKPSGYASSGFSPHGRNWINRLKKEKKFGLGSPDLKESKDLASQILIEMFDNPYKTEFDPIQTESLKKQAKDANMPIHYLRCHKIEGDNGYIMTYHHKGSTEIHHVDENGKSGEFSKKYMHDPRWVGAMYHHIMNHCLSGSKSCRIVAPYAPDDRKSLHSHYKRIAGIIAKKHDFDVKHGEDSNSGHHVATIEIHPRNLFTSVTGLVFNKT